MYPLLLRLGPFALRTAGLVAIGAIIVTSMLAAREIRHRGYPPVLVYDAITPVLLAGLAGARLAYVLLFDPAWYLKRYGQLSMEGGMKKGMVFPLLVLVAVVGGRLPARAEPVTPQLRTVLRELRVQLPKRPLPAPPFSLPDLNGAQVDLAHLEGRVVMLYFWTTY
ncbi:MAG: prolipoprotein diacylglyceryl transferase family protein [Candidatus Methylomirabilia bacterium]